MVSQLMASRVVLSSNELVRYLYTIVRILQILLFKVISHNLKKQHRGSADTIDTAELMTLIFL
jgi:hypothetical protein